MPVFEIPSPFRTYTNGLTRVDIEASTVGEAIMILSNHFPNLSRHLVDEQGQLRNQILLYLDNELVLYLQGMDTPLNTNSVLKMIPAIAGGVSDVFNQNEPQNEFDTEYLGLFGHTPMIEVPRLSPKPSVRIFLKLEGFNASGSVKDRPALYMIQNALKTGNLTKGKTILDATSGNMGIALSSIGHRLGYKVCLVAPTNITDERKMLLKFMGTEVIYTDGLTTKDSIYLATEMANKNPDYCFLNQYANPMNVQAHYETTGKEIITQLPEIDILVSGLGSGGTLMGAGKCVKEHNARVKVIAVEPCPGERLQGLRNLEEDCFVPPIFNPNQIDGRILISGEQAHWAIKNIAVKEGFFIGMSAGAVLACAIKMAHRIEKGNVVAVLADAGWKYMSVGICENELTGDQADNALVKAW